MTGISLFEVIGPNMVGPSSSHTAGAVSMALLARRMFQGTIEKVDFTLYGSFAKTYRGHGTDKALLGGILGYETDDLRIRDSFTHAEEAGIAYSYTVSDLDTNDAHPNTADINIIGTDGRTLFVRGVSIGGGKVKIVRLNRVEVEFTGEYSTLIVSQTDRQGVAAHITKCLSDQDVNIAFMRLFREEKGANAYTVVESDGEIPQEVLVRIRENSYVTDVMLVQGL
ncbi:L-serine ammonia-lyase, iron-sulfur-dependent subunit beta [Kineothrix sp. MB12-C1]|uniref:L-serine ammonia-lyase, iron-sulfur-dependent subunit beta n=1 Tax=Kineothrix sp. MB12-C1 TaxID=3070215 RepID=UPI0027D34C89|nr:L-serine ammonia-lyase, iron-sulfur-dependent subunit beta [Kineothrix sp. MB12-C1]WMC92079.1 L-serine ammonia-lyase, iron-sulfur-dependent subunit beta [Kineothrix sp. MB12-C1]